MSFTIGCDPELICKTAGRFVPAHHFFKSQSSFGLDGCESTAEIRPGYAESPLDLTAKIYRILQYGHEKFPQLEFYSGHYQEDHAIGGHIHLSVSASSDLIGALDVVLGSLSNSIDDLEQKQKRINTGYGKPGAYRRKSYGFEYRSCGSFLISPSVTLTHFTLAKLAVIGTLEDNLDFTELKHRQSSVEFLRNLKHYLHTVPDDCKEGLKQLDLLLKKPINWNQNILPNWGLWPQELRAAA